MLRNKKKSIVVVNGLVYGLLISFLVWCSFQFLGLVLAAAIFGSTILREYPRFIPFLLITACVDLCLLVWVVQKNYQYSQQLEFTARMWVCQITISCLLSAGLFEMWDILFAFLRKIL